MSVYESKKIDYIGIDETTNEVVLSILDPVDWNEESYQSHLKQMMMKLRTYIEFVRRGTLAGIYPHAINRSVRIDFIFREEPIPEAIKFLEYSSDFANRYDIGLGWQVM